MPAKKKCRAFILNLHLFSSDFPDLSQDDQLILIKTGFFEIWLTRMSRMISKEENLIVFEDGSAIPREELAVVFAVCDLIIFLGINNNSSFFNVFCKCVL